MRMKTDRYKDWESRFFEGEELTPEEDLFLKNESNNPYFSFLKEEKKEKMDLNFEDFLKKTEEPKIIPMPVTRKKTYSQYWMAASLILLMGISGVWMFNNPETLEPQMARHTNKSMPAEPIEVTPDSGTENPSEVLAQNNSGQEKAGKEVKILTQHQKSKTQFVHQPKQIDTDNQNQPKVATDSDYNPNYVIINGKPVYSEQEAIAVTEDTFNYFASNVTQTINHAESAQSQVDLYKILNF